MPMNSAGKHRLRRRLLLLAALLCPFAPAAAEEAPTEQALRAAMIFNFLKFTDFPPGIVASGAPLRLCTAVGDPRQAEALAALSGRKVGGRELVVAPFSAAAGDCQVLYADSRQRWLAASERRPLDHTLTISAYPGFLADGGMIEFAIQDNGIRFDINLAEGRHAGFRFVPQLLRLARKVYE